MARGGLMEGPPANIPDLDEPFPFCLLTKATLLIIGPTTDVSIPPPWVHASDVFCVFSMFKASVDLSRLYWIYDLLLHTPL